MEKLLPDKEYYASLPRKRCATGALFFNSNGELLIVKPCYKNHWTIPGGVVNLNESPLAGCHREIKEELGLVNRPMQLICVDYKNDHTFKGEVFHFIFHAGVLNDNEIANLRITDEELTELKFLPYDIAATLCSEALNTRLQSLKTYLHSNKVIYLENGLPPTNYSVNRLLLSAFFLYNRAVICTYETQKRP